MRQRLARFLLLALTTTACRGQAPRGTDQVKVDLPAQEVAHETSPAGNGVASGSGSAAVDGKDLDRSEGQYQMKGNEKKAPAPRTVTTATIAGAKQQAQQSGLLGATG